MARKMKILAAIFTAVFVALVAAYQFHKNDLILTMGITFGTFSYHFLMRLAVGTIVDCLFHNRMDYTKWWFRPRGFEKKLYELLKVKKWKKDIPTYDPDTFSAKKHSLEELAQATCQAEIVHEIIVLLSFLPILLTIPFGALAVFLITSILAALIDCVFVILQRYNRPRLLRLIAIDQKKKSR